MKYFWESFRANPLGWFLSIALILAIGYIITSLLIENSRLRSDVDTVESRFLELVTQKQGPPGADGESAYDIAVRNGYAGTEQDWLNSLKGERGEAGSNGIDGRDGTNGAAGKNGVNGSNGSAGLSVAAPICVGGTQYKWYSTSGTLLGTTKAICLP